VLGKEVSAHEDGHPACNFAHRFKEREAAVHLDRFICDAGCTGGNETIRKQFVGGQMEISKEKLSFAKQPAFRFKRFLDLHNHVGLGKKLFVHLNDFRARRPVVCILKTNSRPGVGFYKYVMASLDELVDGRRKQRNSKFLLLHLSRNADCHSLNYLQRACPRQVLCLVMEIG
jgi:hypothetical protein